MELPIPTHLRGYLTPCGDENDEYSVTGELHCPCGGDFEVWESNGRCLLRLACARCGRELQLYYASRHGWNGFVCHEDSIDHAEPLARYACPTCGKTEFAVTVTVGSQGREDFLEECVAVEKGFTPEDWVDAFESLTVTLDCKGCGAHEEAWAALEAM